MKIKEIKRDVETMTSTTSFKLAEGAEKIVFDMFTSHIYSDPIGSVVREIVSNAVDANEEAGQTNPVTITLKQDADDNYYFQVQDEGIGISPKKFREIYSVYFNSDKRQSNSQIGGWGIGGKTPLAYTESFELTCIYDGVKTDYLIFRGETSPDWTILGEEKTDERNGTTVKIYVKNYSDYSEFAKACRSQLPYFKNVYFDGSSIQYLNDNVIYSGKNFKVSENSIPSLHAIVGPVQYRLNLDKIRKDSDTEVDELFPSSSMYSYSHIGLKFDIGEVDVTVSREDINYTEETVKVIRQRYSDAIDEMTEMYNKRVKNVSTFKEALFEYRNRANITFGTEDDNISIKFPEMDFENKLSFPNYKFDCLKVYSIDRMLDILSHNFVQIGNVGGRYYGKPAQREVIRRSDHYIIEGTRRNRSKVNAYLKQLHEGSLHHFTYLREFEDLTEEDVERYNKISKGKFNKKLFNELKEEFINYATTDGGDAEMYADYKVPEGWTPVSDDNVIKMKPIRYGGYYDKTIEQLKNLNGRFFYATRDQEDYAKRCAEICRGKDINLMSQKYRSSGRYNFNIFLVSKKNYELLESVNFEKVHPITEFDKIMGHRRFLQEYEDGVKAYAARLFRANGYSAIEEFENSYGLENSKEALKQFGVYDDLLAIPDAIKRTIGCVDKGRYVPIDSKMEKVVKQEGTQLYRRLIAMHGDKFETAINFKKASRVLKMSELSTLIENGDKFSEKLVECVKNNL